MKTCLFIALALCCSMLFALYVTCAKESPTSIEEKDFTGEVTGYVYGKMTHRPLAGVIVSINADSSTPGVTDANGKFTVGKVNAGTHRLHFTHIDWEIDSSTEFSIEKGENMTLSDTAKLSYAWYLLKGKVKASGAPVSGAGVALAGYSEGTLTSAGGAFVLRKVPKLDTVELISALGGTGVGFRKVTDLHADDTTDVGDIALTSTGAVVSGIVHNADGKPAANMTVTAVAAGIQARTDDNGVYRLENVPANQAGVQLTVSGGGYTGAITGVYGEDGAYLAGCDIHLSEGDMQDGVVRLNSADVYIARNTARTVLRVTPEMAGVSAILQEYEWDIGGTIKTTSVPRCTTNTASMSGTLPVSVTAKGKSYSGTDVTSITVRTAFSLKFRADKPVIDSVAAVTQSGTSGSSVTVYEGEWIVLRAWITEFFGGITAMTWEFGDGTTWTSPDSNPVVGRLYTQAGTYIAVFQAKDVDDASVKDSVSIVVKRPEFSAPALVRPFDKDTVRTAADSVRLVWNKVSASGITYTVYVDDRTDRPVTAVAQSVSDTFMTIAADSGTTYFWQVAAVRKADGMSARSVVRRFTTFTGLKNASPVFLTGPEDMTPTACVGVLYTDTVSAEDDDTKTSALKFTIEAGPDGVTIDDGIITWTPEKSGVGVDTLVVKVSDGNGGESLLRFSVTVSDTNHAPYFTVADSSLTDTMFVKTTYRDTLTVKDPDSNDVTLKLIDSLPGMTLSGRVAVFTPVSAQRGAHTVRVAVSDTAGAADTLTWTFTVVNRVPEITSKVADMLSTGATGKEYRDTLHVKDADGDSLRFAFVEFPAGMQFADSIITWTPGATEKGDFSVSVSVSDGIDDATLSWTITVAQIPVVTRNPVATAVTEGQPFTMTVGTAGDSLKFKWQKDGGTISGAVDSIYRIVQSAPAHAGLYRCIVYNGMGADTSDTARLTVNAFVAPVVYVKSGADDGGDGSSWDKAYRDLQAGINKAARGSRVWVAAGVYTPDTAGRGLSASFSMKDGVEIYGGFAGNETAIDKRDWGANKTVLSGDVGIAGNNSDNCYHVIYNPATLGVTSSAILDGFTVSGGNASDNGGGMYNDGAWPVVRNCAFDSNTAYYSGGAISNSGGSQTRVENTVFRGNKASNRYGGAVYCSASNATFIACTFEADMASSYYGGAIYAEGSTVTIDRCSFANNQAGSGGAVFIQNSSLSSIKASSFSNNQAGSGGGAVYLGSCGGEITGCTFQTNRSPGGSGGAIFLATCGTVFSACTFYNNMASYGGTIYSQLSTPGIVNCTMSGNQATSSGGAVCLYASKTSVVNTILWGNSVGGNLNDIDFYSTPDSLFLLGNVMQQPVAASAATVDSGTIAGDPLLGTLADNGGEVLTLAIGSGSSALDIGVYVYKDTDGRLCYNKDGGTSYLKIEDGTTYTPAGTAARVNGIDARGVTRPKGAGMDIGAFEKE